MLEVVEKMLSNLKIKIEGTSTSTPCTISKNEKEIVSNKHTDSDTVPTKEILNDELPEIRRFVENSKPHVFYTKLVFQIYSSRYTVSRKSFSTTIFCFH